MREKREKRRGGGGGGKVAKSFRENILFIFFNLFILPFLKKIWLSNS